LGNGDRSFQAPVYYGPGNGALAIADFSGDGKTDMVSGDLGVRGVSVFLGK